MVNQVNHHFVAGIFSTLNHHFPTFFLMVFDLNHPQLGQKKPIAEKPPFLVMSQIIYQYIPGIAILLICANFGQHGMTWKGF